MQQLSTPRRRKASDGPAGFVGIPSRRDPPLHVLVARWLSAGWDVAPDLLEKAAESRATERSQLRDPPTTEQFGVLIQALPNKPRPDLFNNPKSSLRSYGRWLWKRCDKDDPESLHGTLDSMFMGKHSLLLDAAAGEALLDALSDLVKWRMHFNDHDPALVEYL